MTYIVKKSDGSTLTTLAEGTIDTESTSLSLLGRKAVNYGLAIAENFVAIVENHCADAAPSNPLKGQFWFEKTAKKLKVYDGSAWFTIVTITSDGAVVTGTQLISTAQSPLAPIIVTSTVRVDNLNADLLDGFNTSVSATASTIPVRNGSADLFANKFQGVSTSAQYADLAERFEASEPLEAGDVVCLGGEKEITRAHASSHKHNVVLGVISADPGFAMNSGAGSDETHPYVAYLGRLPVKVKGTVKKFDRLVLTDQWGYAEAENYDSQGGCVIGRALEDKTTEEDGLVLAVIGAK